MTRKSRVKLWPGAVERAGLVRSAKRTTENTVFEMSCFSRPFHGLVGLKLILNPSPDQSGLGYFQFVRFADFGNSFINSPR
jgi:hypothetical protein